MPIPSVTFLRERDPRLKDVPEDTLVRFVADTYPQLLERDPELSFRHQELTGETFSPEERAATEDVARRAVRYEDRNGRMMLLTQPDARAAAIQAQADQEAEDAATAAERAGSQGPGEPAGIPKLISRITRTAGNTAVGLATDIGRGESGLPLTQAALKGMEVRIAGPGDPMASRIAEGAVRGAGEMAPALAATAAGVPAPLAFGAQMGLGTLGEGGTPGEAALAAATGAALPAAGNIGRGAAARVIARLVAEGGVVPQALAKTVEAAGSQAGMNLVADVVQAPEFIKLYQENPDKALDHAAEFVGINLAMGAHDILGIGAPSVRSKGIAAGRAEVAARAELRQTIDEAARQALSLRSVPLTERPATATVEPSPPAETITGQNEQTGSEAAQGPATAASAPMPAERIHRPKAATFFTNDRPYDLLDEIEGTIGHIDPKLIREADPNWKPVGAARKLMRTGGSHADQVLQALTYEEGGKLGVTADMGMQEFGEALNAAARARKDFRGAQARYERQLATEGKQTEQFQRRVLEGERPKAQAANVERVPVDHLVEGDQFQVQDHTFTVRKLEFDEDTNLTGIVVRDGPKFGVQTIGPEQEFIHIDKGSMKPVPREEWPAAEPPRESLTLAPPESVAEQLARLQPGGGGEGSAGPERLPRVLAPAGAHPDIQARLDYLTDQESLLRFNLGLWSEHTRDHIRLLGELKFTQGRIDALAEHSMAPPEAVRDRLYSLIEQGNRLHANLQPLMAGSRPRGVELQLFGESRYTEGQLEELAYLPKPAKPGLIADSQLELWANNVLKGGGTHLGPDVFAAYVVKGVALLERGVRKFSEWASRMVAEHGADIRPHLRRIWEEAQAQFHGTAPLPFGQPNTTRNPRAIVRAMQNAEAAAAAGAELNNPSQPVPFTRSVLTGMGHLGGNLRAVIAGMAGESMPRITRADRRAGELGVRYASSSLAAPHAAKAFADEVLGGLDVDPIEFGAAVTEDNLRSVRAGLHAQGDTAAAAKVHTLIGAPDSPFRTEREFTDYLARPGVQLALERHRLAWDRIVDPMYRQAMLLDDLLPLPSRGAQTQARINLFAVRPDAEGQPRKVIAGVTPNLTATFRRKSPFGRRATGSSETYGVDYREIMQNTFARQLEVANKNAFDGRLVESGHAYIGPPGEPKTLTIGGEETVGFPLRRTVLVTRTEGGQTRSIPAAANIYVRKSLAREYELAANLYRNRFSDNAARLTKGFNSAALAGLTDATVHISNLATVLFTRPGNASRNPVADILLSALGRADIPVAAVRAAVKGLRDNSAQVGQLAEIGSLRGNQQATWNPLSKLIGWADRTTRLAMDDTFRGLADTGLVVDNETNRREWTNQTGQYNKRLQGVITHALRETGIGPFVTAGKTFNALGVRNLFLAPGAKATSPVAAATLRAMVAARWVGSAVLIGALNYLLTHDKGGGVTGRPGTPLGRIDSGKNDEAGLPLTVPALDLMGFGRALRISGVRGAVESKRLGLDNAAALDASMHDLVNSWSAPGIGPAVRFLVGAASGYQPAVGVPRQHPVVPPGQSQHASDLANALYEANPLVKTAHESGAMAAAAPWMPYSDQLPPKPMTAVLARQIPRFTLLPGKPAEMIERYPEIVQKAKAAAFVDGVIHRARTMGAEQRAAFVQRAIGQLPSEEQPHAWQEMKRRRVFILPGAAVSKTVSE